MYNYIISLYSRPTPKMVSVDDQLVVQPAVQPADQQAILNALTRAMEKLQDDHMQPIQGGDFRWVEENDDPCAIALSSRGEQPAILVSTHILVNIPINQLNGFPVDIIHNQVGPDYEEPGGWTFIVVRDN